MPIRNPDYRDPAELWIEGVSIGTLYPNGFMIHTSRKPTLKEAAQIRAQLPDKDWQIKEQDDDAG